MNRTADKPSQETQGRAAVRQPSMARAPSEAASDFIDNRPEAARLTQLQEAHAHSPQARQAAQLQAMIDNSPRMVAQRQLAEAISGSALQRQVLPEEQEIQMKRPIQRQRLEDEALLQGSFEMVQRQGELEQEELLQGKFDTVQRQEDLEEKELLQGKFEPPQRQALEEEEPLQRKLPLEASPVQLQQEPASPANRTGMTDILKAGVESLSGMDMSGVRVHFNSSKPAQLNGLAYAQGNEIHLGSGQEKHLPHEAWHTVQQRQGRVRPTMKIAGEPISDDVGLEHDADVMGERAMRPQNGNIERSRQLRSNSAQESPLQFKLLEPEQVLMALAEVEFGGDEFKKKVSLGDKSLKTPQGLSLYEYARARMDLLTSTWETTGTGKDSHYNALLLSYAVDVVSDFISRTKMVNLPRVKPLITQRLIDAFAQEIHQGIAQKKIEGIAKEDIEEMIAVAQAVNGKDPITLYMKAIVPLDEAAKMIQTMARKAPMPVSDYFELLLNQFLDQILSLTPEQVSAGQAEPDPTEFGSGNVFPQKEVVGEISSDFFTYIAEGKEAYKPADNHLIRATAVARANALRVAVNTKPSQEEISEHAPDPIDNVAAFLQEMTGLSGAKSRRLQRQLVSHLNDLAPQVTVPHGAWFDESGLKTEPTYQSIISAQHKKEKASDIIKPGAKGHIDTLGRSGEGPMSALLKSRGPRYMRWRIDKDSRAEGLDLPFELYPIYGCLNYWDVGKWGGGGANYYGDVHFLLKGSVKDRCFYKFTDAGIKRKSLLGLFNDVIVKQRATAAVILGDLIGSGVGAIPTTRIEVVVPGGINITKDVMTIVVSSTVPPKVAQAIYRWTQKQGIGYVGETVEMSERREDALEPVTGMHDVDVSRYAKGRFLLESRRDLVTAVTEKLNNTAWDAKGVGFMGRAKAPTGIVTLREAFNSNRSDLEKLTAGKHQAISRLRKEGRYRDSATAVLYTLLSAVDPKLIQSVDAVKRSVQRLELV